MKKIIVANGEYNYKPCEVFLINESGISVAGPFFSYIPEYKNGMAILNLDGKGSVQKWKLAC